MSTFACFGRLFAIWTVFTVVFTAGLWGCGSAEPKAPDISVNEPGPPLEVPPDLLKPDRDPSMRIPPKPQTRDANAFVLKAGQVSLKKDGNVQWLVVNLAPEQIWDRIQQFWSQRGFDLEWKDMALGIMETRWRVDERTGIKAGSTDIILQRNKYRTRVERGSDGRSAEIYVAHRAQYQASQGDNMVWKPFASDPEKEIEMLHRLLVYLGVKTTEAKNLLNTSGRDSKLVQLHNQDPGLRIMPAEDLDKMWRKVGIALDRSGYLLGKRDQSKHLYEIQSEDETNIVLKINRRENGVNIALFDQQGQPLSGKFAMTILSDVKEHLI